MIKALAISVKQVIQKEIQDSKIFSIVLDETTDAAHTQRVSFVIRYVHNMQITESFQGVVFIPQLEKVMIAVLEENDLNSTVLKRNPKALYVRMIRHIALIWS